MTTHEELKSNPTLIIENIFNEEANHWEVTLNDSLMGYFSTEENAAQAADMVYSAFETGYVNGLLLGFEEKGLEKSKKALQDRGVQFKKILRLRDDN